MIAGPGGCVVSHEAEGVHRGDLARFMRKVNEDRGLDLSQYRTGYLERRIAARLRVLGLITYRQYARYLDGHPDEYAELLDALTINVTEFFRDRETYGVFRGTVVPLLLERKLARRHRMIRAWSAGCATGEEPYSIAMTLLAALGEQRSDFLVSVLGTDIDTSALDVAKHAEYPIERLEGIPPEYRLAYLDVGESSFHVKPEVARYVRFRPLNLFEEKPIHVVDVIFCRNVFIYFTRDQQARVMERFWRALQRGGFLVLGRSEKLAPALAERLELIDGRQRIYRKPQ
jgi:chemotaxis protein methyltransferase CheR